MSASVTMVTGVSSLRGSQVGVDLPVIQWLCRPWQPQGMQEGLRVVMSLPVAAQQDRLGGRPSWGGLTNTSVMKVRTGGGRKTKRRSHTDPAVSPWQQRDCVRAQQRSGGRGGRSQDAEGGG